MNTAAAILSIGEYPDPSTSHTILLPVREVSMATGAVKIAVSLVWPTFRHPQAAGPSSCCRATKPMLCGSAAAKRAQDLIDLRLLESGRRSRVAR